MKNFKNKFAIKFADPILGEAMKRKLIEIGHEWNGPNATMHDQIIVNDFGANKVCSFNRGTEVPRNLPTYTLPQDWEKIIELASEVETKWKIQEFRSLISEDLSWKLDNEESYKGSCFGTLIDMQGLLHVNLCVDSGHVAIHSVTDGEQVIAVGDETNHGKVIKFIEKNGDLFFLTHEWANGEFGQHIEALDQ